MSSHRPTPASVADLADLRTRLMATRRARVPGRSGWTLGTDLDYLADLLHWWQEQYDWRVHEARILDLPWEIVATHRGELRCVHQRSTDPDAPVVVLLHGWPDSVLRFERVVPLLADVHVVVPALPGFPWAAPGSGDGTTVRVIATLVGDAMAELGYERYVVSGGDVGGDVAEHLADLHPDRVAALHLTNISPLHAVFADRAEMSDGETAYLDRVVAWQRAEGGYVAEQSTKPHTLAVGLADSPAGLAAWILEKLYSWSDHGGSLEGTFSREDLATWISAYWLTRSIETSFTTYAHVAPPVPYVDVPAVVSSFAHDTKPAPREFAERFVRVVRWVEHERGGHFAAWEQPEAYVADLRLALSLA